MAVVAEADCGSRSCRGVGVDADKSKPMRAAAAALRELCEGQLVCEELLHAQLRRALQPSSGSEQILLLHLTVDVIELGRLPTGESGSTSSSYGLLLMHALYLAHTAGERALVERLAACSHGGLSISMGLVNT